MNKTKQVKKEKQVKKIKLLTKIQVNFCATVIKSIMVFNLHSC
jgi:hypothetical protein